jgi:formate hydrogenlyase subunit 6/NADH:ubiquinone oxidoreductase subunit I
MLFRTLSKDAFRSLIEKLLASNEVIAPKAVAAKKDGTPVHHYLPIENFDEIAFDYEKTEYSAKTYFLPFRENLSTFDFEEDDWEQEIRYRLQPRVLLGLHPCDINALVKLDELFIKGLFPSPYYVSRRQNTFIVGWDHEPCKDGFCQAVGADWVTHGFDLFLTDLGDRYFVAIDSDRGLTVLQNADAKSVTEQDTHDYIQRRRQTAEGFQTGVRMMNLATLLDIEFDSNVWDRWGNKCLGCGQCAMVCPTCFCYGVKESVSMDWKKGRKVKQLYSCNFVDFAEVAGGHNFRPGRGVRLKYRYYHQHRGFLEGHEGPKCVGCNRCGRVCLVGINPVEVIQDLQTEEAV